jgi:hypothetical protein
MGFLGYSFCFGVTILVKSVTMFNEKSAENGKKMVILESYNLYL